MKMLPLRPQPDPTECFASWVCRVAAAHGLEFGDFVKIIRAQYKEALLGRGFYTSNSTLARINPDSIEHEQFIVMMAAASGLPEHSLEALTWGSRTRQYIPRMLTPVGFVQSSKRGSSAKSNQTWHANDFCPDCLTDKFYLRRIWRPAFPCVCPIHNLVLIDRCPKCQTKLNFYGEVQLYRIPNRRQIVQRCRKCNFDLMLAPRRSPAQQHRRLIELLHRLFEGEQPDDLPVESNSILRVFHFWMEGFTRVCTGLTVPVLYRHQVGYGHVRATYTHHSCQVRYALFEAACKHLGVINKSISPVNLEELELAKWLRSQRWIDFCNAAKLLTNAFPELNDQNDVLAPDRSILPLP